MGYVVAIGRVYYGLAQAQQVYQFARAVCDVLGHGANATAIQMLVETAAQETHGGRYRDPSPDGAGRGLCQLDLIAFQDVQQRTRNKDVEAVREAFGIVLAQVDHDDLDYSPMLSMVFARLFYRLIPDVFPVTVEGRAAYWKEHYNTVLGKGTVDEYIHNAAKYA